MNLEWLHEFVVLARCLNFGVAAKELYVTQPTLSKHIFCLEKELDSKLLKRDTRHVEMTEAGERLLQTAPGVLDAYHELCTQVCPRQTLGTLRIGGYLRQAKLLPLLSSAVAAFNHAYPSIRICEEDTLVQDHEQPLVNGVFDVMFSPRFPYLVNEDLEYHDLFLLPLRVWVTNDNRLASLDKVSLADCRNQILRFLDCKETGSCNTWRAIVLEAFKKEAIMPQVGPPTGVTLALDSGSYALVPSASSQPYGEHIVVLELEPPYSVTLSMIHKRHTKNRVAQLFVNEALAIHQQLELDSPHTRA